MTKLQLLNAYLTERLGDVVREILDVVEDTVSEYLEETARTRRENDSLRRQLHDAVLLAKTDLFVSGTAADVSAVRHVEWTPTTPRGLRLSPAPLGGPTIRGAASEVAAKEEPVEEPLRSPVILTFDPQIKTEPEEADITVTITTDMLPMATDSASHLTPAQNTHPTLQPPRTHTPSHTHTPPHTLIEPAPPEPSRRMEAPSGGSIGRVCVSPLQCGVCGEVCVGRGALEQHQRSGAHRRPFGCECCGRRFTQSADLRRHMRTHTGERPHQCHLCHKRFSQIGNLRRHQRTHTRTHP